MWTTEAKTFLRGASVVLVEFMLSVELLFWAADSTKSAESVPNTSMAKLPAIAISTCSAEVCTSPRSDSMELRQDIFDDNLSKLSRISNST